jgi:hypothetical protein
MWEGFDEPYHLAYVGFVAQNGRPPGFEEPSIPAEYGDALELLPSALGKAPRFSDWSRLPPSERAARRARVERSATGLAGPPRYLFRNYERQQSPLFYYAAAPVAWLLRKTSLPQMVVGVRLFCVLLASFMVPLTARLARLLLPRRGVLLALPFAALLPNTLFYADRVTNDALAWPIFAGAAVALVLAARRPGTPGRFLSLGLLVAAGVWTKMTLLPLLPAALCAVLLARRRRDGRRPGALLAAVGLPALLIAPLLIWNAAACGSWTGVTYGRLGRPPGLRAAIAAWRGTHFVGYLPAWFRNHLWAGGWEFLQPAARVYWAAAAAMLLAALLALRAARRRNCGIPGRSRWLPLGCLAISFVAAMVFHILSARAAERLAGGEGWYFDLLRPLEACAAAALMCAAIPPRSTRLAVAACVGILIAADAAGTFGLLLPHWAGLSSPDWTPRELLQVLSLAREAAPVLYPPLLAALLAAVLLGACVRLIALARPAIPALAARVPP